MEPTQSTMHMIYDYIETYIRAHGYGPSMRDIAENCHMAVATVAYNLDKLEARGWISREFGQARSVRVTDRSAEKLV